MNAGKLMTRMSAVTPEAPAVRDSHQTLTYKEFSASAARFGTGLQAYGLGPGARVVIYMRNRCEYAVALAGLMQSGFVVVPVNVRLHPRELTHIIEDADAEAMIYSPSEVEAADYVTNARGQRTRCVGVASERACSFGDVIREGTEDATDPRLRPDDPAWLFYTSGTTGAPKGAILTHRNLERMAMNCLADVCAFLPSDVLLHVAPLSHGSGLYLLPALARGSDNIIFDDPHFDPSLVLARLEKEQVSVIPFTAPTMITLLLRAAPRRLPRSLRAIIYGGAPIRPADAEAALARFGPMLVQIYGQGEAPMTISYLSAQDHLAGGTALLSAGFPRTDVEVEIHGDDDRPVLTGEIGEVVVRGDVVMNGYWRNPIASATALRGGWLHTGDIGRIGDDGRLYLLDRKNDVIISGGTNVYPIEVETVLARHPGVKDVAVFGVPDDIWGQAVAAAVVAHEAWEPDADELRMHCRNHLASFKKPTIIEFVEELPRNAYGKVLRRALRDRAQRSDPGVAERA
jgi:long-chain acyl-CoA synthetase